MTSIVTLGSHCALQVLKGAKDEGYRTLLICEKKRERLYRRFSFIDNLILVNSFRDILDQQCHSLLLKENAVIIPHGTLISQMSSSEIESIKVPIFGNKWILRWESDRNMKEKLMIESKLNVPKSISSPKEIKGLTIAKRHGAAGGKGYFLTTNKEDYERKRDQLITQGMIKGDSDLYLQEYAFGVSAYLQYFYSPITDRLEFFGIDRRYESDIDGLGRIPAHEQMSINKIPSFNVIGNSPLVLRESLLDEVYEMGERFVSSAKNLSPPGMTGPFCLEGVYDENGKFTTFEFSARIVAGTNLYIDGSPYSSFTYNEPMSMGKRIAREIKHAEEKHQLQKVIS
ncbi:MAG TPA: formate--phosphoribosylaminoimidazolecarboxamide ligase [Candidatus Nitrosotalea sp.]|nr:formate--phosphoribosylaminoimidazolecarboxamide ligase [Candidatus Nitrosotalea sp.]